MEQEDADLDEGAFIRERAWTETPLEIGRIPARAGGVGTGAAVTSAQRVFSPLCVVVSLLLRIAHRGPYYPGLDVVGAAKGLYRVSTMTALEMLRYYRDNRYDGIWNVDGFLPAMIPGWLASWWPSEYWPHVVALLMVLLSLGLVARALGLRRRDLWIVLLAWSASSTLLSFSVAGFAYASCVVPYALALWIVLRWERRPFASAVLCVLAVECSFQVQELGRTVFLVFFTGALLLPAVPWKTRVAWLAVGTWSVWLALHHQDFNTTRFSGMIVPPLPMLWARLGALWERVVALRIDLPVLPLAALVSLVLMPRRRWFWSSLVAIHLTLVVLIAVNEGSLLGPDAVWSRRTLLFSFLCLVTAVAACRERPRVAPWIVGMVLVGSLWQLADTVAWSRRPFLPYDDRQFTLPFVTTSLDYTVSSLPMRWYLEMRDRVDRGQKLLLLYNRSAFDENATDPAAILERLYLHLGHERFVSSVIVFGSHTYQNDAFPIRPMDTLATYLDGVTEPDQFAGYNLEHPGDAEASERAIQYRADKSALAAALLQRFRIETDPRQEHDMRGRQLTRFVLRAR